MNTCKLIACFAAVSFLFLTACKDDKMDSNDLPPCETSMFGQPVEATGLSNDICNPSCECLGFNSKNFTPDQLNSLLLWTNTKPFEELTSNPYDKEAEQKAETVCAIVIEDMANKLYSLSSFSNQAAAEAAGAILTHHDACGLCSTFTDFTVYAKDRDIGAAVRNCGLQNLANPFESLVACLKGLGFSKPCAQIWAYNTQNTRVNCWEKCIDPKDYHLSDGSLNDCLACDEAKSGPVFKAVAGRTRRNTGLASSICRLCEEVKTVEHNYPF